MNNMSTGRYSYVPIIIFLIALATLAIIYNGFLETAAVAMSKQNATNILNSTMQGVIDLGKGKPFSMAFDPVTSILYVVSPSDLNGNFQNMIYVVDAKKDIISDTIKIGDSKRDFLRDIVVDPVTGGVYATGEYRINKAGVTYEYDSLYLINSKTKAYKRISLYSEPEEGKEGDLSGIAADQKTKTIYVGSLYPEGGNPGMYIIDPVKARVSGMLDKWESGIKDILVNPRSHQIVAIAKYDNLLSIINESTNQIVQNITVNDPIAITSNLSGTALYLASGSGEIKTIDLSTGNNASKPVGLYVQDISFNPYNNLVYVSSVNKTMQFSSNKSGSVGKLIALDPKTGVIDRVFESEAVLGKILSDPSTGIVYVLGYDNSKAKLFVIKPNKIN
jgi:hypothetical protein